MDDQIPADKVREVADLQDINRKLAAKLAADNARARDEITSLKEQFTALADQLDHEDEDAEFPKYDPDGYQALSDAADRIRRILEGDP